MGLNYIDIKYFKMAVSAYEYKESDNDIAVRCPICGDSKYHKHEKRLHLYTKNNLTFVRCFNGGCPVNNNMYNFLKLYYPHLLLPYKKERFNNNLESIKRQENDVISDMSFNLNDIDEQTQPQNADITKQDEVSLPNLYFKDTLKSFNLLDFVMPLNQDCKQYLNIRGLSDIQFEIYTGKTDFTAENKYIKIKDSIVIPFYFYQDNIKQYYGFYSRSISEKRFINFTLNPNYTIYNWFEVDKSKEVYIFESIMDAWSFYIMTGNKNIIALNTAKISQERLQELKYPVFCLDNDKTGLTSMIGYTNLSNAKFLIYDKDLPYKDINEILLNDKNYQFTFEKGFKAKLKLKELI